MLQQRPDVATLEAQKREADAAVEAAERKLATEVGHDGRQVSVTAKATGKPESSLTVESGQPWSPELVMTLSLGFLAFALVVLVLMTWSMRQIRNHAAVLRAFGLLTIVASAVFLVIVGYGERQLAPVLGLLGTIAGYLLGKGADDTSNGNSASRGVEPKGDVVPGA